MNNGNGRRSEPKGLLDGVGVDVEAVVPLGEGSGGIDRTLLKASDGRLFQLRRYPSNPAAIRRLETSVAAARHLAPGGQVGLPVGGPDGAVIRDMGCPAVLVELPVGATPLPPDWTTGTMIRLATLARSLERSSAGFANWTKPMDGRGWVEEMEDRRQRADRLASGALFGSLPRAIVDRLEPIVGPYAKLAETDVEEAKAQVDAFESACWDRAIARGFVVRSPAVEDLFLLDGQGALLAWPEEIELGLTWDGLLGEVAAGTLNDDMSVAVQALVSAHRSEAFTDDELALLPVYCSPVGRFLDLVEGAIADAPDVRTDLVMRLLDGHLGDPEKSGAWCRFIRSQIDAVSDA